MVPPSKHRSSICSDTQDQADEPPDLHKRPGGFIRASIQDLSIAVFDHATGEQQHSRIIARAP